MLIHPLVTDLPCAKGEPLPIILTRGALQGHQLAETRYSGAMRRCESRGTMYQLRCLFHRMQDSCAQEEKDAEQNERFG